MKASELKIGDTFKRQGYSFTVCETIIETYKNGQPSILISCTTNGGKVVDSFFHFKPNTKVSNSNTKVSNSNTKVSKAVFAL